MFLGTKSCWVKGDKLDMWPELWTNPYNFIFQQFCTSLAKRRMSVSHHDCSCRQLGLEYIALWHTCTHMGTFPYYISVFFKEVTKTQLSWDGFSLSGIGVNTPTATFGYLRWSSERCHKHWPGLEPGSNSIAEWPDKRSLNLANRHTFHSIP